MHEALSTAGAGSEPAIAAPGASTTRPITRASDVFHVFFMTAA